MARVDVDVPDTNPPFITHDALSPHPPRPSHPLHTHTHISPHPPRNWLAVFSGKEGVMGDTVRSCSYRSWN